MTEPARRLLLAFALVIGGAGQLHPEEPRALAIGMIGLDPDPRYVEGSAFAGIVFRTLGPAAPGAAAGIGDAAAIGRLVGISPRLIEARADGPDQIVPLVTGWVKRSGVRFVLTDLPAEQLIGLADALAGAPVLLLNVSAPEDRLRGADCRANVAHVYPSRQMLTDALAQYLADRGWTDILMLVGETGADAETAAAMRRSAARFGAEIVGERPFVLGNDPRRRDRTNVALMTAGADPDVIFVADARGEFARNVPYRTYQPRPVVGAAGLMPEAWHWTWDRYGAPQVQHRFEALAAPRRMNGPAWAAWVAVKAVMQAAMRSGGDDFATMRAYLLGDALRLDGSKGRQMSFRPWDQQLRQPILLATTDAVIADAPLQAFQHQTNDLDTLGVDRPETECRIGGTGR